MLKWKKDEEMEMANIEDHNHFYMAAVLRVVFEL